MIKQLLLDLFLKALHQFDMKYFYSSNISKGLFYFFWIGLFFLSLSLGLTPIVQYGHDFFILLNGAWRVFQGQVPHTDFHTPLGPMAFYPIAWVMHWLGPSLDAYYIVQSIFFLLLTPLCWILARTRLSQPVALLYSMMVGVLFIGRYPLSFDFLELGIASIFNRNCFALILIIVLDCLFAPQGQLSKFSRNALALIVGLISSYLFFVKLNYFIASIFLVAASFVFQKQNIKERLAFIFIGFFSGFIAVFYIMHWNWGQFLYDMTTGGIVKSQSMGQIRLSLLYPNFVVGFFEELTLNVVSYRFPRIVRVIVYDFWIYLCLFMAVLLASWDCNRNQTLKTVGLTIAVVCVSLFLTLSNYQFGEQPLLLAGFFIMLARVSVGSLDDSLSRKKLILVMIFLCASSGSFIIKNMTSLLVQGAWQKNHWSSIKKQFLFSQKKLEPLVILSKNDSCQSLFFTEIVNDGAELLRKSHGAQRKYLVADFVNPFLFGLDSPLTRGDVLWWDYTATFNEARAPGPNELFADINGVMLPKCPMDTVNYSVFMEIYNSEMKRLFTRHSESKHWVYLEKKLNSRLSINQ